MIIPIHDAFGNPIVRNHVGPNEKSPISLYVKWFHKGGCFPVYRTVCKDKVKIYRNKTFNQMSGILKRLGY